MITHPKVSVVVPVYNVEQYIFQCLESLRRQTLKDIEVICVNDGSTDNSAQIIQEFVSKDSRFRLIDKENEGYGKSMNIGIDAAIGEYIGILEPDDFALLSMYEDLYEVAHKEDLDFVKGDFFRFTTTSNGDMTLLYNRLDKSKKFYNTLINPSQTPEITRFIINTWSGIYRNEFIKKYNIRHNETPGASFQDNGFYWQTTVHAERAFFIDRPGYMNRRDNPNSSVKSKEKVYCMNEEMQYVQKLLEKDELIWKKFRTSFALRAFHNYIFTTHRISEEFKAEYVLSVQKILTDYLSLGMIDPILYNSTEWDQLQLLTKDPEKFLQKYVWSVKAKKQQALKRQADALQQLEAIKQSRTYRVGRAVLYIPSLIKRKFFS